MNVVYLLDMRLLARLPGGVFEKLFGKLLWQCNYVETISPLCYGRNLQFLTWLPEAQSKEEGLRVFQSGFVSKLGTLKSHGLYNV